MSDLLFRICQLRPFKWRLYQRCTNLVNDLWPGVVVITLQVPDISFQRRVGVPATVATLTETLKFAQMVNSSSVYETSLTNCIKFVLFVYVDKRVSPFMVAYWTQIISLAGQPVWLLKAELTHQDESALQINTPIIHGGRKEMWPATYADAVWTIDECCRAICMWLILPCLRIRGVVDH